MTGYCWEKFVASAKANRLVELYDAQADALVMRLVTIWSNCVASDVTFAVLYSIGWIELSVEDRNCSLENLSRQLS